MTASRRPKLADDATLDRIDAAALLWRLELAGVDVGNRWSPVAGKWMAHVDDHVLAFNDLHCAFAAARSPDPGDAGRLSRSLDAYERLGSGDNRQVTAEVGRRLIDGVLAFAGGDYARAVEAILPVRYEAIRIGGSHAQRDIVNLTLIAAAERSGQWRPGARAARRARRRFGRPRARWPRSSGRKAAPRPSKSRREAFLSRQASTSADMGKTAKSASSLARDLGVFSLFKGLADRPGEAFAAGPRRGGQGRRTALIMVQRIRDNLIRVVRRKRRARDAGDRRDIRRSFVRGRG